MSSLCINYELVLLKLHQFDLLNIYILFECINTFIFISNNNLVCLGDTFITLVY